MVRARSRHAFSCYPAHSFLHDGAAVRFRDLTNRSGDTSAQHVEDDAVCHRWPLSLVNRREPPSAPQPSQLGAYARVVGVACCEDLLYPGAGGAATHLWLLAEALPASSPARALQNHNDANTSQAAPRGDPRATP